MLISEEAAQFERMLVDEGLELLAAYRSIPDRTTRLAMKRIVVAVSGAVPTEDANGSTGEQVPSP